MEVLQEGRFARVIRSKSPNSGEVVAVKLYNESKRALSEAAVEIEVLERLTHSDITPCRFIIQLKYVRKLEGSCSSAVALELCDGGDLYDLMHAVQLGHQDALRYCAEIAIALEHLRLHNIIHGDLKPENIGVTSRGHLRLLDFGCSSIVSAENPRAMQTSGTLEYTCPEKLFRKAASFEADWWSLGVILYEMIFDAQPWTSPTPQRTAQKICEDPVPFPRADANDHVSTGIIQAISLLLRKKRKHRLSCLAELRSTAVFGRLRWEQLFHEAWIPPVFHGARKHEESKQ